MAEWCQRVLQRREELRTAASTVVQRCAALGVVFLELRFCPYAHCREGLTPAEALAAVCDGFAAGASVVAEERCASGGGNYKNLQGKSIRYLLCDEVWQWNPGAIKDALHRVTAYKEFGFGFRRIA